MEDRKKGYTFTDRRGRTEEPGPGEKNTSAQGHDPQGPDSPAHGQDFSSPRQEDQADVDFSTLIMSFASAAVISMGRMPDPATGQVGENPALARQNIHIIEMLREKTRGNLTRDEEKLLENILYELRMGFVESQKRG